MAVAYCARVAALAEDVEVAAVGNDADFRGGNPLRDDVVTHAGGQGDDMRRAPIGQGLQPAGQAYRDRIANRTERDRDVRPQVAHLEDKGHAPDP